MLKRMAWALGAVALVASPALAQDKGKVPWMKPDAALATARATGKAVCWYFLIGAAPEGGRGNRPGC